MNSCFSDDSDTSGCLIYFLRFIESPVGRVDVVSDHPIDRQECLLDTPDFIKTCLIIVFLTILTPTAP